MGKINFADVKGFEPVSAGNYKAIVKKATYVDHPKDAASGDPFIKFEFECVEEGYETRKFWRNCSLKATALWATKKALIVMGINEETLNNLEDTEQIRELLPDTIGATVELTISEGVYNGKPKNDVDDISEASVYNF